MSTERECPRALQTMQKVQRLSQPSCILIPGRVRPVGVGCTGVFAEGVVVESSPGNAPAASRASITRAATFDLSGSTTMLSPSERSSSAKRLATQPVAKTTGLCGILAARRTALRVLACASPVTAQVLMTIACASRCPTSWHPCSWSLSAMASSSTRLTRHPRLTSATPAPSPVMLCGPCASRASRSAS